MEQNKEIGIIITYEDFLKISDEMKQKMLYNQQVEWFVYIKKDQYEQLSEIEKQKLEGFKLTEQEPLRLKRPNINRIFEIIQKPEIVFMEPISKDLKKQHRKNSKPYVPRTIGKVCSQKKGGR